MSEVNKIKPRALKAGDAASYLGISRRGLWDLSNQGKIPVIKLSTRVYLYDISDLDKLLDSCKGN